MCPLDPTLERGCTGPWPWNSLLIGKPQKQRKRLNAVKGSCFKLKLFRSDIALMSDCFSQPARPRYTQNVHERSFLLCPRNTHLVPPGGEVRGVCQTDPSVAPATGGFGQDQLQEHFHSSEKRAGPIMLERTG